MHVKNRKMENRSGHRFGLTDLNKTMQEMCDLTRNIFDYFMRRFFFGLV